MQLTQLRKSLARLMHVSSYALGIMLVVNSFGTHLLAGAPQGVPEIDASSISAGLGLLAGGVLMLRARRRSK